jgi:hypothetical protein
MAACLIMKRFGTLLVRVSLIPLSPRSWQKASSTSLRVLDHLLVPQYISRLTILQRLAPSGGPILRSLFVGRLLRRRLVLYESFEASKWPCLISFRLLFDSTANQNRCVTDRTEVLLNQYNDSTLRCQVTKKDSRSDAHTTIVDRAPNRL